MTSYRILDREEFIARASYDLDATQERNIKKVLDKPTKPSLAERAEQYSAARAEGMNPDEAAQTAGWKNFNSAQAGCCRAGIKLSAKAPAGEELPRKAAVINQEFVAALPKPEPVIEPDKPAELIPDRMEPVTLPVKAHTLRPCSWVGKDFLYTDIGDCIDIRPKEGAGFQLTREGLKQFSEEINELLEIIKF